MRATKVEIRRVARAWYQSRISAKSESRSGPDLRSDTFAAKVTAAGKPLLVEDPQMCRVAMQRCKKFSAVMQKKRGFREWLEGSNFYPPLLLTGEKIYTRCTGIKTPFDFEQ